MCNCVLAEWRGERAGESRGRWSRSLLCGFFTFPQRSFSADHWCLSALPIWALWLNICSHCQCACGVSHCDDSEGALLSIPSKEIRRGSQDFISQASGLILQTWINYQSIVQHSRWCTIIILTVALSLTAVITDKPVWDVKHAPCLQPFFLNFRQTWIYIIINTHKILLW